MSTQGAFGAFGSFGSFGAFGAFGAFGGAGSFGSFGSSGAFGGSGANSGYAPNALVQHRDSIVGSWKPQLTSLAPLPLGSIANLDLWEPWVRAEVVDFDLMSNLHFGADATGDSTLWHVVVPPTNPAGAVVNPIATLIRPADPTSSFWLTQLDIVNNWADLRQDRAEEIITQLSPPVVYWSTILNLHPQRTKWTLELIAAALRLANFAEMRFKHALACRRPIEYSPQVQPMILTPGHGSLPSGHATEAFIVAYVLWKLVRIQTNVDGSNKSTDWLEQLMRQAARVAINRTVAGVHFPVDSAAGQLLGLTLGEYFVCRATSSLTNPGQYSGRYEAWRFNGSQFVGNDDFDWRLQYRVSTDARAPEPPRSPPPWAVSLTAQTNVAPAPLLARLWSLAQAEWP